MPRKLLTIDVSTEAESAMMIIALSHANCEINVPDNFSFHPSLPSPPFSPLLLGVKLICVLLLRIVLRLAILDLLRHFAKSTRSVC